MKRPLLSIIIVSWNVRDLLAECLESLEVDHVFDWAEVFVVDNLSSDGSVEMVRRRFSAVRLITPASNLGYARGNNLGIHHATGEYLFLLNPDTVVHPGAVRALVDFAVTHPRYGLVGPKQLDGRGNIRQDGAGALPTSCNVLLDLSKISDFLPNVRFLPNRKLTGWDHADSRDVPAIPGSAMLVPGAVINRVGGLDETMFIVEDMDFCKRIADAGYGIYYLATASIVHYGGQSLSKRGDPESYVQIALQSFWLYLRKYYGRSSADRMSLLFMVSSCFAVGLFGLVKMMGISAASGRYRTAHAIFQWTLHDKETFTHDLAAPANDLQSRRAEVA
jgi:N-acetylglucosaminyl-diphospho-decaprenol L-rhamnosyltransferase